MTGGSGRVALKTAHDASPTMNPMTAIMEAPFQELFLATTIVGAAKTAIAKG